MKGDVSVIENFEPLYYNCGGFALSTYTWVRPFEEVEDNIKMYPYRFDRGLWRLVGGLLEQFNVRCVTSFKYISSNEYPVVFRVGSNDFHFMRYSKLLDGWVDKMGGSNFINLHKEKEVMHRHWYYSKYDSQIVKLAAKKNSDFDYDEDLIRMILYDADGNIEDAFLS